MDNLKQKSFALWGKVGPYKSLIHHLIDAGAVAETYLTISNPSLLKCMSSAMHLSEAQTIRLIGYFVACHDIGKAHPWFQLKKEIMGSLPMQISEMIGLNLNTAVTKNGFRHEKHTPCVLYRIWEEKGRIPNEFIDEITCVLADHHQKNGPYEMLIPSGYRQEYEAMQNLLEEELLGAFEPKFDFYDEINWSEFCEGLNGILVLSDWISSDPRFHSINQSQENKAYFEEALEESKKVIGTIGFSKCSLPTVRSLAELYGWNQAKLRPMQMLVDHIALDPPLFSIIEDSPGAGKTEAALYLAVRMAERYGKDGLYFALPTAATANQMWERLNRIFSRFDIPEFRLIHGTAWSVVEKDNSRSDSMYGSDDEIGEEWLRASRRSLLSQFAVGTIDQVMMSVLTIKFRQLRMLGLTNKVLILDEVHAYDAYMSTIIDRLLDWCAALKIPVVMLSATLPKKKKENYIRAYIKENTYAITESSYPLVTSIRGDGNLIQDSSTPFRKTEYEIELVPCLNDLEQTAQKAVELIAEGGNLCLMLNTIKDAQEVYKKIQVIKQQNQDIDLLLYHAGFKAKDRRKIEEKCLALYAPGGNRPVKSILVCTQVVEQSLDVDFDILMTQICPIDLLVQRMGREWRHDLQRPAAVSRPKAYIMTGNASESAMGLIYDPYILHNTEEYLLTKKKIKVPDDLRKAISFVYDRENESAEYYESYFNSMLMQTSAEGRIIGKTNPNYYFLAEQNDMICFEDNSDHIRAATRLGRPTTRVVLADQDLYLRYKNNESSREIQQELLDNSVCVSISIPFEQLEKQGVLKGVLIVQGNDNVYRITDDSILIYDEILGRIIRRN